MSSSGVPPLSSTGVFTVADSILIDAPREKVWEILLDFGSYKQCRGQTIVSASGTALADQTPAAGKRLLIGPLHLPPTMGDPGFMKSMNIKVLITTIDHENFRVTWVAKSLPRWVLHVERRQMLTVEGGKTKYENIEVFRGIFAYLVKFFAGKNMVLGVRAMMEGLKSRAEGA
ncbi:hypothetical protein B0H17DRAFT_1045913 [Mycena rosella]|uniref:SRPBCC family protein n=1 Tax=Mycena rosella TaxID=1033263 RepID=A0AAD7GR15_MYCRO|nr:hypothetical protein B0H17DRAFT_1045913 [Mycena rosella]